MSSFINCSLPEATCEEAAWFVGGVRGSCGADGRCLCPSGFSGADDFALYNDCHVSDAVLFGVRMFALVVSLLCTMGSVYFLVRITFIWGLFFIPEASTQTTQLAGGSSVAQKAARAMQPKGAVAGLADSAKAIQEENSVAGNENGNTTNAGRSRDGSSPGGKEEVSVFQQNGDVKYSPSGEKQMEESLPDGESIDLVSIPTPVVIGVVKLSDTEPPSVLDIRTSGRRTTEIGQNLKVIVEKGVANMPRPSVAAIKDLAPGTTPRIGPRATRATVYQERRRKRLTLGIFVVFLVCTFDSSLYLLIQLTTGATFAKGDAGAMYCFAIYVGSILVGMWFWSLSYYGNLPSLSSFGKLFEFDSILLRYPRFVEIMVYSHSLVTAIASFLFLLILPCLDPANSIKYLTVMLYVGAIFGLEFAILFNAICSVLLACFKVLIDQMNFRVAAAIKSGRANTAPAEEGKNLAQIEKARLSVQKTRIICAICAIGASACYIVIAEVEQMLSNLWLIAPIIISAANSLSLVIIYHIFSKAMRLEASSSGSKASKSGQQITT